METGALDVLRRVEGEANAWQERLTLSNLLFVQCAAVGFILRMCFVSQ
jgi:hypothetical protein